VSPRKRATRIARLGHAKSTCPSDVTESRSMAVPFEVQPAPRVRRSPGRSAMVGSRS
jgi:hypothetical protein